MLSDWLRVIRIRFLLASVIAVSIGLSLSWVYFGALDLISSILIFAGVLALHASVDLLNDYWDFKRGIDSLTFKTKLSGGTGVLPEGRLNPNSVYHAGILFLIIGGAIGAYFVITHGIIIGIILGFAILSIYFYSTKIVNWGLGEVFVTIKGTMIVLGTFFIQTGNLTETAVIGGLVSGVLSSFVLFIASFPDHDADKSQGRRTLVILLGKHNASRIYFIFPLVIYSLIVVSISLEILPIYTLIVFFTLPLLINAGRKLIQNHNVLSDIFPVMTLTLKFSRISGMLFIIGILCKNMVQIL